MESLVELVDALSAEAVESRQRRLVVIHGSSGVDQAARQVVDALAERAQGGVLVADKPIDGIGWDRCSIAHADELLGTTQPALVYDARSRLVPNVVGRTVGTVDAGGLYVLLAPPLDEWPDRVDGFDASLAVEPYEPSDVGSRFRHRFVATLESMPGVAIFEAERGVVDDPGQVDAGPAQRSSPRVPADHVYPGEAFERCLTWEQSTALSTLEALDGPESVVVLEADRGRGKSSAAGLAVGSLVAMGHDVLVTARGLDSAGEVFARAGELLDALGVECDRSPAEVRGREGQARFRPPAQAVDEAGGYDAIVVDEAAALPVRVLEALLAAGPPIAFATTVHGYEGASRGFSVRFKDRLDASDRPVRELVLEEPIRYARGDPVEAWAFRALSLDARPPVDALVEDAEVHSATYHELSQQELAEDEQRLRQVFGLLVMAHYQTEPNDLARLLDAPNVRVRALLHEDRVVSVALLAEEGNLPGEVASQAYEGSRIRGHMVPDVLLSQLRDPDAGDALGLRVNRIATHPAARSRGLGSHLLGRLEEEARVDWLGVGYGATPELVRFWRSNGFQPVHVSTSRNEASGEHSAIMLNAQTDEGRELEERSVDWFIARIEASLSDPLREVDPDVVLETLASVEEPPDVVLSDREWRLVASAAYGPGLYDTHPGCFRRLAMRHLVDRGAEVSPPQERLLVAKVLQARSWERVTDELGFPSTRTARQALGRAFQPLVDVYAPQASVEEAQRFS